MDEAGPPPPSRRGWWLRAAGAGFWFFLVKGLLWLLLPALAAWFGAVP